MSNVSQIDTSKVVDFRKLRYQSIADLRRDIDCVCAADAAGTLRWTGNWTAGQAFGHLATWINYGYEGFPMRVPWFIRMLIRQKLKSYLANGMPRGVRIPRGPAEGTWGTDALPTDEGARRLRAALDRLERGEPAKYDSPAFGKLSDDHRIALNLRHAELHLSYLHP